MTPIVPQLEIERLSIPERIELIGLIWDSIVEADPNLTMPEWHRRELERRRAAAEADPQAGIPWEDLQARLTRP